MINTQQQFVDRLQELFNRNVEISRRKNKDYSGIVDPFKNFKSTEVYGIPAEKGILVRMADKMTRISNLLDRPPEVVDESVLDTLSDLANYAMILRMYIEHTHETKSKPPVESVVQVPFHTIGYIDAFSAVV